MGSGWQGNLKFVLGGMLLGYFMKDSIGQFLAGLQSKAISSIPVAAPPVAAPVAPIPGAPVAAAPGMPVRQALAGEVLYPGAFPSQEYDASNEYYNVAYPAEASNILIPSRRFDKDNSSYSSDQVNSLPPMW